MMAREKKKIRAVASVAITEIGKVCTIGAGFRNVEVLGQRL